MNRPDELITYNGLPKSSGGAHKIRIRNHHTIWNAVAQFLEMFTSSQSVDDVGLVLFEGKNVERDYFKNARKRAVETLGRPQRSLLFSRSPGQAREFQNLWQINSECIPATIDLMTSLEPFPKHWLGGPLVLRILVTFSLFDLDTSQPFPNQGREIYGDQKAGRNLFLGDSILYLRLAHPSTCFLFLSLPFSEVTPELQTYVRKLEETLPFKLSRKQWSRWQLNSKGTRYYNRKISVL